MIADLMFGPFRLSIDRSRLARRIAGKGGSPISDPELDSWLNARGFVKDGDLWVAQWLRSLLALMPEEVIDLTNLKGRRVFRTGASYVRAAQTLKDLFDVIESRNSAMAQAAEPDEIEKCRIPVRLIGRSPKVASSWRTITKRAARAGNWDTALQGMDMIPIDHAPGDLLLHHFAGPHDWTNVALHAVHDHFATDTRREDRAEWGALERRLLLDGINRFWFCIASLDGHWSLILDQAPNDLKAGMARQILTAFVHWWPEFIRLSPRFLTIGDEPFPWPRWGWWPMQMCLHLGATAEQIKAAADQGPVVSATFMSNWIAKAT